MSASVWRVERTLPVDHPALAGHFPGQPLFPGVVLLGEVLEAVLGLPALVQTLGDQPRVENVKFLSPVMPGAAALNVLTVVLSERPHGVDFELWHADLLAVRGQLRAGARA